jgi:AmmeMemoRadiSam system protein B
MTTLVRPAAVAGSFYPGDARELVSAVDSFLDVAVLSDEPLPKALIVPHAGYVYSGATAGAAYARLTRLRGAIQRVVLLGPAHRVWVDGISVPSADAFATPLGIVPVDDLFRRRALAFPQVRVGDRAHASEHALEVQLPFLQRVLGEFSVLPLVVGDASTDDVAQVIDALWGGNETLVVVSSDLSHYHDYDTARSLDARTAAAIVAGNGDAIRDDDACGARPVRGLLEAARHHGLDIRLVDLRNSGDTGGDHDAVVGYGAFTLAAR